LFQVTVGMAAVLLIGTLNRVMIVELGLPAWLVATMISLPLVFAPFRMVVGYRSDTHRSVLGWRRVPYIWFGNLLQFGGLAIMPFALILLSGDSHGPPILRPSRPDPRSSPCCASCFWSGLWPPHWRLESC
jgi:BCD family chlorophyll transporter-like MFS transporter